MDAIAIETENQRLRDSWNCFSAEHLDTYLGVDEQDQRINAHSILTRALLIDSLWPGRFTGLITEEMRYGLVMTWLLQRLQTGEERGRLLDRILRAAEGNGDEDVPSIVRETAAWLQDPECTFPDYISDGVLSYDPNTSEALLAESALQTFTSIWDAQLAGLESERIDVLEVACGSGTDYQTIQDSGIGQHISYSGLDISKKNVHNARKRFPHVDFFEASILDSGLPDDSFDYVFAHDVIGHLSEEGMERALSEIMRMTRREAWIHCFNAVDIETHEIIPFFDYHKNRISIPELSDTLQEVGAETVEPIPLPEMFRQKFNWFQEYTATSATFIACK